MIKHTTFRNKTLNVSTALHPDGKIQIDENGIVVTELTDEGKSKLLKVSGFVNAEPAPPPNLTKPSDVIKIPGVEAPADSILILPPVITTDDKIEGDKDPDENNLP